MRISTNTIYQAGISRINDLQTEQAKLQQQISTGKRITSPSDDPVAAAQALQVSYAQSVNSKFADTRTTAGSKLNTLESNLDSVTNLIVSTQSTLVGAGNGSLSNSDRQNLATELTSSLQTLIGLSNAQDASGNFIYSGFKTNTAPFVASATGATYTGDSNQQLLQVDSQRQMAVSVPGNNVFQANGNDVFNTLSNLVTLLNTPITDATTQAAFNTGLTNGLNSLQGSLNNVLNIRASVGSNLNEIDSLNTYGSDRDLQYSKTLSGLQDLDYNSALSDLSKNQTILTAAQKSFVATTNLSLFSLI